jgi:hypothetical protein
VKFTCRIALARLAGERGSGRLRQKIRFRSLPIAAQIRSIAAVTGACWELGK